MADTVADFFERFKNKIDSSKIADINAVYQFHITGANGGDWWVKLNNGTVDIQEGVASNPSISLTATAEDWLAITQGQLSGPAAFATGRLKIQGDIGLAMRLQSLLG